MFIETLDLKFDSDLLENILLSNPYVCENQQTMINSRSKTPTMDHIFEGCSFILPLSSKVDSNVTDEMMKKQQRGLDPNVVSVLNADKEIDVDSTRNALALVNRNEIDLESHRTHDDNTYLNTKADKIGISEELEYQWDKLLPCYVNTYIEDVVEEIKTKFKVGRIRTMIVTGPNCYSFHKDLGKRIHIPIITNQHAHFMDRDKNLYNLHEVGRAYLVDTTQHHTFLNMSAKDRLHIVMAAQEL